MYASLKLLLIFLLEILGTTSASRVGTISVFRKDEIELHKYSAVLAAIEPLRLELQDEIEKSLNPLSNIFHKIAGTANTESLSKQKSL